MHLLRREELILIYLQNRHAYSIISRIKLNKHNERRERTLIYNMWYNFIKIIHFYIPVLI